MPRNEDGEFELILGNRQLLSVFFVVVVLLGVFFTMGYIVGRSSGPEVTAARRAEPLVVDPRGGSSGSGMDTGAQPAKPLPTDGATSSTPAEPPKAERKKAESPAREPEKMQAKKTEASKAPAAPPPAASNEPQPGQTYLQTVATTRPDAEMIAGVLRKKGFASLVAPGPNETIFRVLVGPLPDAAAVNKTRADLKDAGFPNAMVRRY